MLNLPTRSAAADPASVSFDWNARTEKQLREAIAEAPAHGLKPELFLKGGEEGEALSAAALKYASALANGYSDPTKLHEVYTIPRPKPDVRQGLSQALQNGNVKEWLNRWPPQTDEYKALSQAFLRYANRLAQADPPGDRRATSRSSRARATRAFRPSSRCFVRAAILPEPRRRRTPPRRPATRRPWSPRSSSIQAEFRHEARRHPRQGHD